MYMGKSFSDLSSRSFSVRSRITSAQKFLFLSKQRLSLVKSSPLLLYMNHCQILHKDTTGAAADAPAQEMLGVCIFLFPFFSFFEIPISYPLSIYLPADTLVPSAEQRFCFCVFGIH